MIVLDNSVISAFCEIKRYGLLRRILSGLALEAVIPSTVEREIVFEEALASLTRGNVGPEKWLRVVEVRGYEKYMGKIPSGEAGVIALAERENGIAALDDLDAREVARGHGVRVSGTLGIIKLGYELCPIEDKEELEAILEELRSVHFRMDEEIETEVLNTEKRPR